MLGQYPMNFETYIDAGNPATTGEQLFALAFHPNSKIRQHVAENSSTPVTVLLLLTGDFDPEVRLAVAENPHFPPEYLGVFIEDASSDLRFALAENGNLPEEFLRRLSQDENPYIAQKAQTNVMQKRTKQSFPADLELTVIAA